MARRITMVAVENYTPTEKTWKFMLNYARNRCLLIGGYDSGIIDFYAGKRHIGDKKYFIGGYSYDAFLEKCEKAGLPPPFPSEDFFIRPEWRTKSYHSFFGF